MNAYWNSQSPSFFPMQYQNGEIPILEPRLVNHMSEYQGFEFPPTFDNAFIPRSVMPTEADHTLNLPEGYQMLNLHSTVTSDGTISPSLSSSDSLPSVDSVPSLDSPSSSDSLSDPESQDSQSPVTYPRDAETQRLQTVRRRMQNREAQRRFRGRKEERYQALQQRTAELEAQCQELSNGFNQKCEEISKIFEEKEALMSEVQDLRKRWRLTLMLLRRPNRLQSLSGLMGSDLSSQSAAQAEPLDLPLEALFGCLQELLVPNETTRSAPLYSAA